MLEFPLCYSTNQSREKGAHRHPDKPSLPHYNNPDEKEQRAGGRREEVSLD